MLRKTVVGLFRSTNEVDQVVADLQAAGIDEDAIKVADHHDLETGETLLEDDSRREPGIRGVLNRLFGAEERMEGIEHDSPLYEDWVRDGGFLVAVSTDETQAEGVTRIMEGYVDAQAGGRLGKETLATRSAEAAGLAQGMKEPLRRAEILDEQTIPVIQEELHVGKRKVQRSSVRVVKHVTETPVEETIDLRDETVTIDRHPVDRIASEADLNAFGESTVELIETVEEPVVSKEAHVVEEVTIKKSVADHQEKIRDTIKRTDIDIEEQAAGKSKGLDFRKDFNTRFGKLGRNYSDYAPAYEFGNTLASDARYQDRDWSRVEFEVRRQWESKGQGSWKDFGEAIRHAFESRRGRRAA